MDVQLYQRLFLLALELDGAFGNAQPSLQYIITTTEPPPIEVCTLRYLRNPVLSAESADTKILGIDY